MGQVRHADLLSFTCLKAYALDQRHERKYAHDLVYCLEHADGGLDVAAEAFRKAQQGKHAHVIEEVLSILGKHFADDSKTEGYQKDARAAIQ